MPHVTPLRPGDPRRVGRYRLMGRVDDFAGVDMARQEVFLAQRVDGTTVMAAFPGTGRADDAAARDRFVAEARVARNIPPFCVARVLDAGVEGSQPYLITEFVPGPSLAEVVHRRGPATCGGGQGPGDRLCHRDRLHPPGRARARSVRPGHGGGRPRRPPGGALQHYPALRRRDPRRRHPGLGAGGGLRGRRVPARLRRGSGGASRRPAPGGGRLPEPGPGVAPACPRPADRTAERRRPVRRAAGRGRPPQPDGRPSPGTGPPGTRRGAAPRRPLPRGPVGGCACLACIAAIAAAVFFIIGRHPGTGTPAPDGRTPPPAARWPRRTCPSPRS